MKELLPNRLSLSPSFSVLLFDPYTYNGNKVSVCSTGREQRETVHPYFLEGEIFFSVSTTVLTCLLMIQQDFQLDCNNTISFINTSNISFVE